jgi:hypothetical protein
LHIDRLFFIQFYCKKKGIDKLKIQSTIQKMKCVLIAKSIRRNNEQYI